MNRSSYPLQAHGSGFTLIELMVTIAVLAIITSIAAPNISNQLANQRVKSTTATLTNALKEAKAESTIRRQSLTLTYNNNGATAGTINIANIASYSYDAKSTISDSESQNTVTFRPSKTANAVTYTVCDSNSAASPRQVVVSRVAIISSQLGGTCP